MAFERIFRDQYDDAVDRAQKSGTRGGFVEGGTVGVASALIYIAEGQDGPKYYCVQRTHYLQPFFSTLAPSSSRTGTIPISE